MKIDEGDYVRDKYSPDVVKTVMTRKLVAQK